MLIRGRKVRAILTFLTSSVYPHNTCEDCLEHCSCLSDVTLKAVPHRTYQHTPCACYALFPEPAQASGWRKASGGSPSTRPQDHQHAVQWILVACILHNLLMPMEEDPLAWLTEHHEVEGPRNGETFEAEGQGEKLQKRVRRHIERNFAL
jgi:hypothetical protein